MDLEHKSFELKELSEEGQLSAVISTFGAMDRDGDVMDPAAFAKSNGKAIPMVWAHDWNDPVGRGVVTADKKQATFTGQFFLDTQRGQEAYKTVRAMGELQQYSIGFRVVDQAFSEVDNGRGAKQRVRTIKDLELFEASPVLVGAAYGTRTVGIKAAGHGDIHDQLKALREEHEESCELGDECPLAVTAEPQKDDIDLIAESDPERAKNLREMEQRLGYRPLIAHRL